MSPVLTKDLKVRFLGITPFLKDKTGSLNPQQIVSLSALATFKGKSIRALLGEIEEKGQDLDRKIKKILQRSSLKGHASIATTPALCLSFEGSKFLDSALTGIVFSSSLMASGRRTGITKQDIVFPEKIFSKSKAQAIYQKTSEKNIRFFNFLLDQTVPKDEASKILQYGIYGTGILHLPIESVVLIKKEFEAEKEWMPQEVGILLQKIEKSLKKLGVDWLYATRETAPRNVFLYPNIFKNPQKTNLVRELVKTEKSAQDSKVVSIDILAPRALKEKLRSFKKKRKKAFSSFQSIKKNWPEILFLRQEILRDYNLSLRFKILSSVPWRVWGEKKRHRTCLEVVESIYYCVERAVQKFDRAKNQIQKKKLSPELIQELEKVFSIPPTIQKNPKFLVDYLLTALNSFAAYKKLLALSIKPKEAIFLIPRAVKIDVLQEYDLYNLLTGYYPLRLCMTAEEEMRRNTLREVAQLRKILEKKGLAWLNEFIGPKCEIVGFCPEEKSCPLIKRLIPGYNQEFHQAMKEDLNLRFQNNLKNLGK